MVQDPSSESNARADTCVMERCSREAVEERTYGERLAAHVEDATPRELHLCRICATRFDAGNLGGMR